MNLIQIIANNQEVISIRDFGRNLAHITDKPKSKVYTIVKNGKTVGRYVPEKYATDVFVDYDMIAEQRQKYTGIEELEKHAIASGEKHLSQRVDEILYGAQ